MAPLSDEGFSIQVVTETDLRDLLPMLRAYCDFYGTSPPDAALLGLCRALLGNPLREGIQLIARDSSRAAAGFATIFWTWSTTRAARIGVMNDLFVVPSARGTKLADRLIRACVERCALNGARRLEWQTAPDNVRAQAVYDRVGARRESWLDYAIDVDR
jgi:GNAT superfamily N-acetyltransferase